ncbi:hypothetical protein Leryth_006442 [Lithospermum erythrorhizon]|uniref:Epidermal patterning factor-like protein n=1 Tax=Lithospermum erythrorhizon TaxID=34254 RepID=A0AAV3PEQ6_LITER|nr:hypothetical protein Leryth_006442 [Lithospermum erythrorhizon]
MAITSISNATLNLFLVYYAITSFYFLPHISCFNTNHNHIPDNTQGLLVEEKTRLGSTPPSCHNKCNQCHPCMAVQVPTMPSHNRLPPLYGRSKNLLDYYYSSPSSNRYSNYKPLGWKCRCDGHIYNP